MTTNGLDLRDREGSGMTDTTMEHRAYAWVEDVDSYIDDLIRQVGDNEMRTELEDIKTWPEAAKTAWLLDSDERSDVQLMSVGACVAIVLVAVASWYVWTEYITGPDGVVQAIKRREKRIKEVEKMVHEGDHTNGKCPDNE